MHPMYKNDIGFQSFYILMEAQRKLGFPIFESKKMIIYAVMKKNAFVVDLLNANNFIFFAHRFKYADITHDTMNPILRTVERRVFAITEKDKFHERLNVGNIFVKRYQCLQR